MSAGFGGGSYTQSANAQERNQEATVFVGGLDENVTDELLWELMIQAGPVKHVYIPRDRITRQAQGYGFCEFRTEEDAQYAVKILNMVKMFGKPIKVQPSSEHKRNLDVGANIFVGNLDPDVDEKLLHDTFNAFGVIIETPHIMRELETGNSKGYGFVKFNSFEASDSAIEAMNGGYIMNRSIVVQYAYKKDGNSKERHGSEAERLLAAKAQGTTGQTRANAAAAPPAANGSMGLNVPHAAAPGAYSQGPPAQTMPGNGPPAHSGMQPPQGPPPQVMAPPGMPPHGPPPRGMYGYNALYGGPDGNPMSKGMPPPMRQPGNYGHGGGPVAMRPPGPPPPGSVPPSHPPPYGQGGAMYPQDGRGMPPPMRVAGADQVPQYGMQQPPGYRGPPPVHNAGVHSGARPPPPPTGQHGQPPGPGVPYGSGMQRAPSEMPPPPPPQNPQPPKMMPPPPQSNGSNGY